MAYEVTWLDDSESCIVVRPSGMWTWEEFQATFAEAHTAAASKPYRVDYIADLSAIHQPPGPHFLGSARRAYSARPENAGLAVIVNAPMPMRMILEIISKVLGGMKDFYFVDTLGEAVAMIAQQQAAHDT